MKPVDDFQWITKDLIFWQGYNDEVRCNCGSCGVLTNAGWIIFDPVPLLDAIWEKIGATAPLHAIVLTNGNHQRDSLVLRDKFDVNIYAPTAAKGQVEANVWLNEGNNISGMEVIELSGASYGETAYCNNANLIIGDALININKIKVLPNKYCTSPKLLQLSLQKLLSLNFECACFAHGSPIISQAKEVLKSIIS